MAMTHINKINNTIRKVFVTAMTILLTGAMCFVLSACSGEEGPVSLAIIEGVHKNAGVLPMRQKTIDDLLHRVAQTYGSITLVSGDGDPAPVFQASIPKPETSGLSSQKRTTIAKEHVKQLQAAMQEVTARVGEVDTLKAIRVAAGQIKDNPGERTILILDTGVSTTGYVNLTTDTLYAAPEDVVEWLRSENALPDLSGINITWYWNGTAEPQQDLTESQNSRIRALWHAILEAAGAASITDIEGDNGLDGYVESLPAVSCVEPEEIVTPEFETEKKEMPEEVLETIVLEGTQLRFVGNKAEFIDEKEADDILRQVAEQLLSHPENQVYIAGSAASSTVGHDETFCLELSEARAKTVKNSLIAHGVPEQQILSAVGLGFRNDPFHVPDLNESGTEQIEEYARLNRVVRIVDVYSEDGSLISDFLQSFRK